jgi:hypothetical protein
MLYPLSYGASAAPQGAVTGAWGCTMLRRAPEGMPHMNPAHLPRQPKPSYPGEPPHKEAKQSNQSATMQLQASVLNLKFATS